MRLRYFLCGKMGLAQKVETELEIYPMWAQFPLENEKRTEALDGLPIETTTAKKGEAGR